MKNNTRKVILYRLQVYMVSIIGFIMVAHTTLSITNAPEHIYYSITAMIIILCTMVHVWLFLTKNVKIEISK